MFSSRRQDHEELGAYTTVAQTEAAGVDPTPTEDVPFEAPIHIGSIPTAEDMLFLPRVADTLPHGAFLVAIVELCERFAYYGLSGPFQNYIANDYDLSLIHI